MVWSESYLSPTMALEGVLEGSPFFFLDNCALGVRNGLSRNLKEARNTEEYVTLLGKMRSEQRALQRQRELFRGRAITVNEVLEEAGKYTRLLAGREEFLRRKLKREQHEMRREERARLQRVIGSIEGVRESARSVLEGIERYEGPIVEINSHLEKYRVDRKLVGAALGRYTQENEKVILLTRDDDIVFLTYKYLNGQEDIIGFVSSFFEIYRVEEDDAEKVRKVDLSIAFSIYKAREAKSRRRRGKRRQRNQQTRC